MNNDSKSCGHGCQGLMWWTTLVVAVLAIPAAGILIALMSNTRGFMAVAVFMVACWICTYLGMRLMKNPKVAEKFSEKFDVKKLDEMSKHNHPH